MEKKQKQKTVFLKLSKAKDSYFGVSEATLFETVFEMQNNYKKDQQSVEFRLFWDPKGAVVETKKQLFLRLFLRVKKACFTHVLRCFKLLFICLIDKK